MSAKIYFHLNASDMSNGIELTDGIHGVDPNNGDIYGVSVGTRDGKWYTIIHNETTDGCMIEEHTTHEKALEHMDITANDLTDREDEDYR